MKSKQSQLVAAFGPQTASSFGGGSAGANVGLIQSLPEDQKTLARKAFSDSLSTMWILYVAFAAVGIVVSLLITRNKLDKVHEETKTGIEAEKEKRAQREAERVERAERRKLKASKGSLPLDSEAKIDGPRLQAKEETDV